MEIAGASRAGESTKERFAGPAFTGERERNKLIRAALAEGLAA